MSNGRDIAKKPAKTTDIKKFVLLLPIQLPRSKISSLVQFIAGQINLGSTKVRKYSYSYCS